jgi:hypothetical protein
MVAKATSLPSPVNTHCRLRSFPPQFYAKTAPPLLRFAVGQTIGQAMVKYKLTDNPEPTTFSKEEIDKYFGGVSDLYLAMPAVVLI